MTLHAATPENTLFDGGKWPAENIEPLWYNAWVDAGPSPAGNAGPYLKLPVIWTWENGKKEELIHRIYLRPRLGKVVDIVEIIDFGNDPSRWVFETNRKVKTK